MNSEDSLYAVTSAVDRCVQALMARGAAVRESWSESLQGLAAALGADNCALVPLDSRSRVHAPPPSTRARAAAEILLNGPFAQDNPRVSRHLRRLLAGDIIVEENDDDARLRTHVPYFRDFALKYDICWVACIPVASTQAQWCLIQIRGARTGPFAVSDIPRFEAARPQLQRLLRAFIMMRRTRIAAILDMYDTANVGAILLDATGALFEHNASASRFFGPALRVVDGRLAFRNSRRNESLETLVLSVARGGPGAPRRGACQLQWGGTGRLGVEVLPIPDILPGLLLRGALLLLSDFSLERRPSLPRLQAMFGLSDAEARVAVLFAAGDRIDVIAEQLHLDRETVRTHVRRIFAKSGVNRQAAFVALGARFHSDLPTQAITGDVAGDVELEAIAQKTRKPRRSRAGKPTGRKRR